MTPTSKLLTFLAVTALFCGTVQAELVFETTSIQKSADPVDDRAEAVFKFTNNGEKTVKIEDLKSSCGCTVPSLGRKEYAPGESGEIKAVFDFGPREGEQVKHITVKTDEAGKTYTLTFTTLIPELGSIEPRLIRWRLGEDPKPKEVHVHISNPDIVQLKDPKTDYKSFTMEKVDSSPGESVFKITPKSTTDRATESAEFELVASHDGKSRDLKIAVFILVR